MPRAVTPEESVCPLAGDASRRRQKWLQAVAEAEKRDQGGRVLLKQIRGDASGRRQGKKFRRSVAGT